MYLVVVSKICRFPILESFWLLAIWGITFDNPENPPLISSRRFFSNCLKYILFTILSFSILLNSVDASSDS
eukprot:Pgem_evm1s1212